MNDATLVKLVKKVHRSTMTGKMRWEKTVRDDTFQKAFPDNVLKIVYWDGYRLEVCNSEGLTIDSISADDFSQNRTEMATMLNQIYDTARRQALGAEKAIEHILANIEDDEFDIDF